MSNKKEIKSLRNLCADIYMTPTEEEEEEEEEERNHDTQSTAVQKQKKTSRPSLANFRRPSVWLSKVVMSSRHLTTTATTTTTTTTASNGSKNSVKQNKELEQKPSTSRDKNQDQKPLPMTASLHTSSTKTTTRSTRPPPPTALLRRRASAPSLPKSGDAETTASTRDFRALYHQFKHTAPPSVKINFHKKHKNNTSAKPTTTSDDPSSSSSSSSSLHGELHSDEDDEAADWESRVSNSEVHEETDSDDSFESEDSNDAEKHHDKCPMEVVVDHDKQNKIDKSDDDDEEDEFESASSSSSDDDDNKQKIRAVLLAKQANKKQNSTSSHVPPSESPKMAAQQTRAQEQERKGAPQTTALEPRTSTGTATTVSTSSTAATTPPPRVTPIQSLHDSSNKTSSSAQHLEKEPKGKAKTKRKSQKLAATRHEGGEKPEQPQQQQETSSSIAAAKEVQEPTSPSSTIIKDTTTKTKRISRTSKAPIDSQTQQEQQQNQQVQDASAASAGNTTEKKVKRKITKPSSQPSSTTTRKHDDNGNDQDPSRSQHDESLPVQLFALEKKKSKRKSKLSKSSQTETEEDHKQSQHTITTTTAPENNDNDVNPVRTQPNNPDAADAAKKLKRKSSKKSLAAPTADEKLPRNATSITTEKKERRNSKPKSAQGHDKIFEVNTPEVASTKESEEAQDDRGVLSSPKKKNRNSISFEPQQTATPQSPERKNGNHLESTTTETDPVSPTKKRRSKRSNKQPSIQQDLAVSSEAPAENLSLEVPSDALILEQLHESSHRQKSFKKSQKSSGITNAAAPIKNTASSTTAKATTSSLTALLDDLITTRNEWLDSSSTSSANESSDTFSQRLVHQLEKMLDCFVQLSDSLDVILSFGVNGKSNDIDDAREAAKSISVNYAPLISYLWKEQLLPMVKKYWVNEPQDKEVMDLLYQIALLLKILASQFKYQFFGKCEPAMELERNPETKQIFVTLFELLRRDVWALHINTQEGVESLGDNTAPFVPSTILRQVWAFQADSEEWQDVCQKSQTVAGFRKLCLRFLVRGSKGGSTPLLCPKAMELLMVYRDGDEALEKQATEPDGRKRRLSTFAPATNGIVPVSNGASLCLQNLCSEPLEREHLASAILDRIVPCSNSNPQVRSITCVKGGPFVGKTTLVACVCRESRVRNFYADCIVWLHLPLLEQLSYARYILYLREIMKQLGVDKNNEFEKEFVHVSTGSEDLNERELVGMIQAKQSMSSLLRRFKRVLLVLDNVGSKDIVEWFNFVPGNTNDGSESVVTLLVTTRRNNLLSDADSVRVSPLTGENESVGLLHQEYIRTGNLLAKAAQTWVPTCEKSDFAGPMARNSFLHPMALTLLGKYLGIREHDHGQDKTAVLDSIEDAMDKCNEDDIVVMPFQILNWIFKSSAEIVPGRALMVCVVAFVVVFCNKSQLQSHVGDSDFPRIPAEIVKLLFEVVLTLDEENVEDGTDGRIHRDKENSASLLFERLCMLGVLSDPGISSDNTTFLAHSIYKDYAEYLRGADEAIASKVTENGKAYHRALATNILDSEFDWDMSTTQYDTRMKYAVARLPFHMIAGNMTVEAESMLGAKSFVNIRLDCMDLLTAVQFYIQDADYLLAKLVPGPPGVRPRSRHLYSQTIRKVYKILVASVMKSHDSDDQGDAAGEVSKALVDVGLSYSEWDCWEEAISCWKKCQDLPSLTDNEEGLILYLLGEAHVRMRDYNEAKVCMKECLHFRRQECGDAHIVCVFSKKKIADILWKSGEYSEALNCYSQVLHELKSSVEIEHDKHINFVVGDIQEKMGTIYSTRMEFDAALKQYMDSLRAHKKFYGKENSYKHAFIYNIIGVCLLDKDETKGAKEAFEKALKVTRRRKHDSQRHIAKGMLTVMKDDDISKSVDRVVHAAEIMREQGETKERIALVLYTIGHLLQQSGKDDEQALELLEASYNEAREVFGDDHVEIAKIFCVMARIMRKHARYKKAVKLLQKALQIQQHAIRDSPAVKSTKAEVSSLRKEMKDKEIQSMSESHPILSL